MIFYNERIFKRCFNYRKRYWYKNLKEIPTYFRLMHFLIKNGYDKLATYDAYFWFTYTMRDILEKYNANRYGTPALIAGYNLDDDNDYDEHNKVWDSIINRMIFLLGEMDEDTCQRKNPYEEEFDKVFTEFTGKYGLFGEKLNTQYGNKSEYVKIHLPDEIPEYKEISDKHLNAEIELEQYRAKCKDEFFELFSKHFYNLWD